jgi:hypothetical protein
MKMKKIVSLSLPPIPKDLLDKLISAVIQEEGEQFPNNFGIMIPCCFSLLRLYRLERLSNADY